jgi:hypothetical protein
MTHTQAEKVKQNHTATPWKATELDGELYLNPDRESGEYALIAKMTGGGFMDPTVRRNANAAHIVHCVNVYPQLMDAIERVLDGTLQLDYTKEDDNTEYAVTMTAKDIRSLFTVQHAATEGG